MTTTTTVESLAAAKRLDPAWLRGQGVEDLPGGGVSILYRDENEQEVYRRVRDVPGDPQRFRTPKGARSIAYGRWRLAEQDSHAVMHVCEGESDTWAFWAAGLSAVGLAGSSLARRLDLADLGGAADVYVCVQRTEGDPAADAKFRDGVLARLAEVGYAGRAWAMLPPPGVKDYSDLRADDPAEFAARLERQRGQAKPLRLPGATATTKPHETNGTGTRQHHVEAFPEPIPASLLKAADPATSWVWEGLLKRGEIMLLSALWKSGKTTLLAHLLKAFGPGGTFLGMRLTPSRVLYVTEESEGRWATRRDALSLEDHVHFLIRPFRTKPGVPRWEEFLTHVGVRAVEGKFDVVVFDTLANLWPIRDENDAAGVQACLMPMHSMIESGMTLLLVHHTRKSDGAEATASRGSGALTGFVDTIVEFRRYLPGDRKDRRRVLSGYGRDDETPQELVIELTPCGYVSRGDRESVGMRDLSAVIKGILPPRPPGYTADQVADSWPAESVKPGRDRLAAALKDGAEAGTWERTGHGRKGSPYLYFIPFNDAPNPDSPCPPSPYRGRDELESEQE